MCPFDMPPASLEYLLTLWHKILQAHLAFMPLFSLFGRSTSLFYCRGAFCKMLLKLPSPEKPQYMGDKGLESSVRLT